VNRPSQQEEPQHDGEHELKNGHAEPALNQLAEAEKQLAALKKACPLFFKCEEYDDLKKAIAEYRRKAAR